VTGRDVKVGLDPMQGTISRSTSEMYWYFVALQTGTDVDDTMQTGGHWSEDIIVRASDRSI